MNKTQSEWVKNPDGTRGWVWNPITGSLGDCPNPNARKLANGRLKERYLANDNIAPVYEGRIVLRLEDPFYPRFWEDRLNSIGKPNDYGYSQVKHRKGISVCEMSDLFGIGIPDEWIELVLGEILRWPEHRFYLRTKQPQNLPAWSPFPDNCWVGVPATDSEQYSRAVYWLKEIEAKVKYILLEPLLERIQLKAWPWQLFPEGKPKGICDQVIIGAQTKPYKPPEIEHIREIVEACDKAGVPVFLRNNLVPLFNTQKTIPRWATNQTGLRQEMPNVKREVSVLRTWICERCNREINVSFPCRRCNRQVCGECIVLREGSLQLCLDCAGDIESQSQLWCEVHYAKANT